MKDIKLLTIFVQNKILFKLKISGSKNGEQLLLILLNILKDNIYCFEKEIEVLLDQHPDFLEVTEIQKVSTFDIKVNLWKSKV